MTKSTLTLSYPHVGREHNEMYLVEAITNSTDYHPGTLMTRSEVDDVIRRPSFSVTIKRSKGIGS